MAFKGQNSHIQAKKPNLIFYVFKDNFCCKIGYYKKASGASAQKKIAFHKQIWFSSWRKNRPDKMLRKSVQWLKISFHKNLDFSYPENNTFFDKK